jgi:hypothetical protein
MDGLVEGVTGVILVELGPEDPMEGIASVGPGRGGGRQVGEQGQALGLSEDGPQLPTFPVAEVDRAKQLKSDHAARKARIHGSVGQVSLRSLGGKRLALGSRYRTLAPSAIGS